MFFRCKRYPTQLNIVAYKDYKRNLNKKLRNAKRSHFNSKLDESKSNNKKYWEIIRELTKGTTGLQYPPYFNEGGQVIKEDLNIANKFNDYFINIGPNIALPVLILHDSEALGFRTCLVTSNYRYYFAEALSYNVVIWGQKCLWSSMFRRPLWLPLFGSQI